MSLPLLVYCYVLLTDHSSKIPKNPETYKLLVHRGILGTIGFITFNQALHYLPLSLMALLSQLAPIWIGIAGKLFFKENFGLVHVFLTITCLSGLLFIIQPEFIFGESGIDALEKENLLIGTIIAIIFSMICAAILMMIRNLKGKVNVTIILYYLNFFSVVSAGIGSNFEGVKTLDFKDLMGLAIVGVFNFLAQISRNRALYLEKAFLVGVGSYLQLIMSYFLDIFILGIELSGNAILGTVVVMVSIVLMMYYDFRKTSTNIENVVLIK